MVGDRVGPFEGPLVGAADGPEVVGTVVGPEVVGTAVGPEVVGALEGLELGVPDVGDEDDGVPDGATVGGAVGPDVAGLADGPLVGDTVGGSVGEIVDTQLPQRAGQVALSELITPHWLLTNRPQNGWSAVP